MIVFYSGVPGSGKSYAAICEIAEALERGKVVAANIPLAEGWATQLAKGNVFRHLFKGSIERAAQRFESLYFHSEDLGELQRVALRGEGEERGVMVLDELHRKMNARTWDAEFDLEGVSERLTSRQEKERAVRHRLKQVSWFSAHRHYGWRVVVCVQDVEMIDRQLRPLGEYFVICRNAKRFFAWLPLPLPNLFLHLWCWNDRKRTIVRRKVKRLRRRYFRLYNTHALAATDFPDDAIWMPRDA